MIRVNNLSKRFGRLTAVNRVSFTLEAGQTLALVGPSGCGKTTTLKMINRLVEPSAGEIFVDGENILALKAENVRRSMGYVIQDIGLFPHYTVAQNIAIGPKLHDWNADRIQKRTLDLLQRLHLDPEEHAHKYPQQLSGGQQQRVGIARALAADPPIILMDEPFGALDPITRQGIRKDFRELEELSRKTTILVTHDIEEAFEMSDLVCLLDKGEIQQFGRPEDLLFRPANNFVKEFLKGKLVELELRTLILADIFDHLPASPPSDREAMSFSPETSVFELLSMWMHKESGVSQGMVTLLERHKKFDFNGLMEAVRHFRTLE